MNNTMSLLAGRARRIGQLGFTMVELSIVLVVAGLILVAVLKGTDTINKAKVERAVADLKGLQGMVLETQKRINRLPGDCNNDGIIGMLLPVQRTFLSSNGTPIVDAAVRDPAALQVGGAPRTAVISATANEGCTPAGGTTPLADASNFVFNEMRRSGVVDGHRTNMELAQHNNQDIYLIGAMQDITGVAPTVRANVIVMYGIPVWLAEAIDAQIDGVSQDFGTATAAGPATTGRVRRWDNVMSAGTTGAPGTGVLPYFTAGTTAGQYNAGTTALSRDDLISISYQFDTIKLPN